jgi:hypothetical protein
MVWHFSYRWLFHCITFFLMLGWEIRKKLIQGHRKRVSEIIIKVATVEKLRGLFGFSLVPLHH